MKKVSKIVSFGLPPVLTLILFIIVGKVQTYREYKPVSAPVHHAMSSDIYMNIWIGRGIYSMLLVMAISFVLLSKKTIIRKTITFLLLIFLNVPAIYLIYAVIPFPQLILIIPVINLLAFAPFYITAKPKLL